MNKFSHSIEKLKWNIIFFFFRSKKVEVSWMSEKKRKNKRKKKFSGFGKIRIRGHLNYREVVLRFERQSTFHGISHAALASNTKWRIIWYTAFIICFCALLIQIILLIRRYRTYPKSVDLDVSDYFFIYPPITKNSLIRILNIFEIKRRKEVGK